MIRLLFIIFVAATVLCSSCAQKSETQKCEGEKGDTCVTQKGDRARNNLWILKN